MFLSINGLRFGRSTPPFASIAVLMVVGMLLALPASAQNNNGSGSEGKDPVINGFKPFGDIELPWNNQTGAYDSVRVKSSEFTATDPGLAQPARVLAKEVRKGVGVGRLDYLQGSTGSRINGGTHDPKNKYYFDFTVTPGDMGNKKTAQSYSGSITIDATALGLNNAVATQPSVTITLGPKGGSNNKTSPPPPPPPPGTKTPRIHLKNKIDIFGGSNKPSTASTRISLRAGRTGGALGGSGGVVSGGGAAGSGNGGGSGAAGGGGGNGGGGGQKSGSGGGGGAAGGGNGGGGGQKSGSGGGGGAAGGGNGGGSGQKGGS